MAEVSITEAANALRRLGADIPQDVLVPALQDHVHRIERSALEDLRSTSTARGITGQRTLGRKSGGGLSGRMKQRKPLRGIYTSVHTQGRSAGSATLNVKAYGLTALIEQGGRTKPHRIAPLRASLSSLRGKAAKDVGGRGSVLAFRGGAGTIFARSVDHPGSTIRPHKVIEATLRAAEPHIARSVDAGLLRVASGLGLG